jgi:hypothetical protein
MSTHARIVVLGGTGAISATTEANLLQLLAAP